MATHALSTTTTHPSLKIASVSLAHRQKLGMLGELMAARYLEMRGYRVLDQNWRCPRGEIDLIVENAGVVIGVEVKTRSDLSHGHPFEAISSMKLRRMRGVLIAWCASQGALVPALRLDAIAIVWSPGKPSTIEHLKAIG